jgi:hypothetical protein
MRFYRDVNLKDGLNAVSIHEVENLADGDILKRLLKTGF